MTDFPSQSEAARLLADRHGSVFRLPPALVHPEERDYDGWLVPTERQRNIAYRNYVIGRCRDDLVFRQQVLDKCKRSMAFWHDTFVWTYKEREIDAQGRSRATKHAPTLQPYIGWPVLNRFSEKLDWCLAWGQPLVVVKSRDMLATWHALIWTTWHFLFDEQQRAGILLSRKEDLVDSKSPGALFPRLRFILGRLPPWMRWHRHPATFANITNSVTGSSIDGNATTEDVAVGERPAFMIYDEASRNDRLAQSIDSTKDACDTRVLISTPLGPGKFKDLAFDPDWPKFYLGYWAHPEKGRGAEWRIDESGFYTRKPGTPFIWTPWLEQTCIGRSPADIAANIMLNFDAAGGAVFDSDVLIRLGAMITPPIWHGSLLHEYDGERRDILLRDRKVSQIRFESRAEGRGQLTLWCNLFGGRPDQLRTYVIFADVSNGLSASNSVAVIADADTGEKVGQWVSASTDPAEYARVLAMLGLWWGGTGGCAAVGWETNGPGQAIEEHLVRRLVYPKVWYQPDQAGKFDAKPGWTSSRTAKIELLESLRAAYARGEFVERDPKTLEEAGDYVWYRDGGVGPASLKVDLDARGTHGDRVIATAGAWMMAKSAQITPRMVEIPPPIYSQAWEEAQEKREKERESRRW